MNVAQYYAGINYGAGAMARFAETRQPVRKLRHSRYVTRKTQPACKPGLQKATWSVLLNADDELLSGEVYDLLPKVLRTKRNASMMRSLLAYWSRSDYLVRAGEPKTFTYRIKGN